jgi:formylglycine-generating enzyme
MSPNGLQSAAASASSGPDEAEMALIPAGEFQMGCKGQGPEEEPVHTVCVDAFHMDKHEVTNRRFARFVRATGYRTELERSGRGFYYLGKDVKYDAGVTWRHPFAPSDTLKGKGEWPVVWVGWNDAVEFCKWAGKRLPTEAEWEKAARGGLEGKKYPWGDADPASRACYGQPAETGRPGPVGKYAANGYGLFDMAGNVWEWCADWYGKDYYKGSPPKNPAGPSLGESRVTRGGAWGESPFDVDLRCSRRDNSLSASMFNNLGFRCVKSVR